MHISFIVVLSCMFISLQKQRKWKTMVLAVNCSCLRFKLMVVKMFGHDWRSSQEHLSVLVCVCSQSRSHNSAAAPEPNQTFETSATLHQICRTQRLKVCFTAGINTLEIRFLFICMETFSIYSILSYQPILKQY